MTEGWSADIMNDPLRDNRFHVELQEGGLYRGRLYQDDFGKLQLQIYAGTAPALPVDWLLGIIERFREDLEAIEKNR